MNNNFDSKALTWDTPDKIARAKVFADKVLHETSMLSNVTALEYGAGTGLVSFCLKDAFLELTLADNSVGMLNEAQRKINASCIDNISVINIDFTKESLNKKFNVIYSLLTMHHIHDVKDMLLKFNEHLCENGKIIIADLDSEDGYFHGAGFDGHNGFDRNHLLSLVEEAGFKEATIETLTEIHREDLSRKYSVFILTALK